MSSAGIIIVSSLNLIIMKKGITFFIPCSGLLFLTLAQSFTNPVTATTGPSDTAYYFNERGQLLWQQPSAMYPGCYVIKTRKKFQELYSDFLQSDSVTTQGTQAYKPAEVQSISRRLSKRVEKLIRAGNISDPLVLNNVFEILDKQSLHRMRIHIKGSCGDNNDSSDHTEYGGLMKQDGSITFFAGNASDPMKFEGSALYIRGSGTVEYHSHPAGYVEASDQGSPEMITVTGSKTRTSERKYIAYIQGPSSVDQEAVGNRTGYVFGMSSKLIYVYDNEGVKATLPIAFAEKICRKKTNQKKIAQTSLASM
jgi:hypothetical protein